MYTSDRKTSGAEVEEGRRFVIRQAGKLVDRIKLNAQGDHASGGANLLGGVER